jgi:hypothetical protein
MGELLAMKLELTGTKACSDLHKGMAFKGRTTGMS